MLTVLISIVLIFLAFQDQEKRKPVNYIKDQNVVYKVNKEYFYNDKVNDNIVLFRKASKNYLSLIKSSELENIDITNKKDYEKFYNIMEETHNFFMDKVFSQDLSVFLNKYNICVRSGNHCSKLLKDLIGIGNTCRISLNIYNTKEDILNCYWEKWQKNMQRIGKEWN